MKIKDFLNLESQKVEDLTGKNKAKALLTSVINELITNGNLKNLILKIFYLILRP